LIQNNNSLCSNTLNYLAAWRTLENKAPSPQEAISTWSALDPRSAKGPGDGGGWSTAAKGSQNHINTRSHLLDVLEGDDEDVHQPQLRPPARASHNGPVEVVVALLAWVAVQLLQRRVGFRGAREVIAWLPIVEGVMYLGGPEVEQ